jgi:hypothetical protein
MATLHKQFGFLQPPLKAQFLGVQIEPLLDYDKHLEWFNALTNIDGFIYPLQIETWEANPRTGELERKVEKSERPASVYQLPASHSISIQNPIATTGSTFADDALIIYLLAFAYGTRLQLSEWKFEGRIPVEPRTDFFISERVCIDFLTHTYAWWKNLLPPQRTKFINILYVYTRARSLEWDWEEFVYQYMTFDALYQLYIELSPHSKKHVKHKERLRVICKAYDIPCNEDLVEGICSARNELFHEAMWAGSTIGFGSANRDAFYFPRHLAKFNSRVICNIAGYKNDYAKSPWWTLGRFGFDRPNVNAMDY